MSYSGTTQLRVRYGETDKMGVVYYGNFPLYFEVGRNALLRNFNMSYRDIEDDGIILPVVSLNVKYFKPALYDDLLTITTTVREMPAVKIIFDYQIHNESGELIAEGDTILVFTDSSKRRPCRAPESLVNALKPFFE
jgi:acyl-CoA thioester hydrolase